MTSRLRTLALLALVCTIAACGDHGNENNANDNGGGGIRTATPAHTGGRTSTPGGRTATPASPIATPSGAGGSTSPTAGGTPVAIPCPVRVTYIAEGNNADLDTGWTGIYHDTPVGVGGALTFAVQCPGQTIGSCGTCTLSGPVASTTTINNHRCVNDSSVICTSESDCPSGACAFFFGPEVPVSAGGVPVCFTNRVAGTVTGTLSPETGNGDSSF